MWLPLPTEPHWQSTTCQTTSATLQRTRLKEKLSSTRLLTANLNTTTDTSQSSSQLCHRYNVFIDSTTKGATTSSTVLSTNSTQEYKPAYRQSALMVHDLKEKQYHICSDDDSASLLRVFISTSSASSDVIQPEVMTSLTIINHRHLPKQQSDIWRLLMIEIGAAYDSTTSAEARTAQIDVRYLPPPVQQSV